MQSSRRCDLGVPLHQRAHRMRMPFLVAVLILVAVVILFLLGITLFAQKELQNSKDQVEKK